MYNSAVTLFGCTLLVTMMGNDSKSFAHHPVSEPPPLSVSTNPDSILLVHNTNVPHYHQATNYYYAPPYQTYYGPNYRPYYRPYVPRYNGYYYYGAPPYGNYYYRPGRGRVIYW